jgi:hypothetical protein
MDHLHYNTTKKKILSFNLSRYQSKIRTMKSFLSAAALLFSSGDAFVPPATSITRSVPALSSALNADRRGFLVAGGMAAATALLPNMPAIADGGVDYKAVASDIMDLVKSDPDKGPSKFISFTF